jgi:predicted RNA-binding protein (virulence factor B family)
MRQAGGAEGLVYHSDLFDDMPLVAGASVDGWVVKVRPDGKVDVTLRQVHLLATIK